MSRKIFSWRRHFSERDGTVVFNGSPERYRLPAGYRKAISLLLIALARDPALSFFLFLFI
jgi:hypothetical protein